MSDSLHHEPNPNKEELNPLESSSSVNKRNLESTQDNTLNSENKPTENLKELDSLLSTFYQGLLIFNILLSGCLISFFFIGTTSSLSISISALLGLVQWFIAFNGLRKRDFGKMKKAFNLMKLYLVYQGIVVFLPLMRYGTEFEWPEKGYSDIKAFYNDLLSVDFFSILAILLTIKFRNILKTVEPNEKNKQTDPLAKLNSWRYTIYKYWLVIYFCWILKNLVQDIYEQQFLSQIGDVLALMTSDINFFIQIVSPIVFVIFHGLRIPFVFEAIRNKDLMKAKTALKISIAGFVVNSLFEICSDLMMLHEGRRPAGYLIVSLKFEINILWWLVLTRLLKSVGDYLLFIYGASRIRNLLMISEKDPRHKL